MSCSSIVCCAPSHNAAYNIFTSIHIAKQKQQPPSQTSVTRYEPRIGLIDFLHPVDKQRMIVMKANKKIGKLLRTKRPRPDGYHDPDYEISDSDEEDIVAQLEPMKHA